MTFVRSFRRIVLTTAVTAQAVISISACGDGNEPKTARVSSKPMPEGETWTGVYFHPVFGELHLQEEGANVVGRWKRTDKSYWGELSGTATGNVLHYTWKEHRIGMVGPSATTKGRGYFVYKMNSDKIGILEGEFGLNDSEVGSTWNNLKQQRSEPNLKSIGGEGEGLAPGQLSN